MHKLLKRQLNKNLKSIDDLTPLQAFLEAIDSAYEQADKDRLLLERSLDLTSKELNERNQQLRSQVKELNHTKSELEQSLSTLNATFDATGEATLVFDSDGKLQKYNKMAAMNFDVISAHAGSNFVISYLLSILRQIKESGELVSKLRQLKTDKLKHISGTIEFYNGSIYEYHSLPQKRNNELLGRVWCARDITNKKLNEAKIFHQAHHDALTGLPNRTYLLNRLDMAIDYAEKNKTKVVVAFLDLDHFKKVNDSCGHKKGDMLLIEATLRIQSVLRRHDLLSRIGGDEFVILMENIKSPSVATNVCKRIMEELSTPFKLEQQEFYISTSIGLSICPIDDSNAEELIRKADIAMYHAKEKGRGNFQYFDHALERLALHQLDVESKLRQALKDSEFVLHYQPRVDTQSHTIHSAEALIRWQPPGETPIPPMEFIPIAENTGLIIEIGDWVLNEVCRQLVEWSNNNIEPIFISLNISVKELLCANFVDRVESTLNEYQVSGKLLEFEITETIILEDIELVLQHLNRLHKLGVSISIDDFGTGYSSMQYLQKLPIDCLKIDKSFILNSDRSEQNSAIVSAIIALGHGLKLKVIAEGVETLTVSEILSEKQCDLQQGYYHYKPMPAAHLTELLNTQTP
ncbi:EAL domain-containing protein [Pleionea sp. CnH1-48]|uniref:EAL domain-containing protein n=1 Tax=Pleionea sp. CnH1-48 TaxID=2954494 RepID=UPI0020978459|nr:EAL domain-containing protein [Pleionea sp. CnH1-48]MCO7223873.1 EAL domain-containing protein [Pleionea sp. CnH1-48]